MKDKHVSLFHSEGNFVPYKVSAIFTSEMQVFLLTIDVNIDLIILLSPLSGKCRPQGIKFLMRTSNDNPFPWPRVSRPTFSDWRMWVTIEIGISVITSLHCCPLIRADSELPEWILYLRNRIATTHINCSVKNSTSRHYKRTLEYCLRALAWSLQPMHLLMMIHNLLARKLNNGITLLHGTCTYFFVM